MITPCEVAVKSVVPAIKALVACELVEKHGLKQDEVAEILGISQSAVSKYTGKTRGYVIRVDDIEDVRPMINSMIALLLDRDYERNELLASFCQTCAIVRKSSLMCEFCRKSEPKLEIEDCSFCLASNSRPNRR